MTRCLDLIHTVIKFHQNIPYGYLVMACMRIVYHRTDGLMDGQLDWGIILFFLFLQNRCMKILFSPTDFRMYPKKLLSTYNIRFHKEIKKKISIILGFKKNSFLEM